MKKLKLTKVIASTLIVISVLALNPMRASAQWKQNTIGKWYTEGNYWATGWRNIDGKQYYFYDNGYMAYDTTVNGHYLNINGILSQITTSGNFKIDKSTGTIVGYIGGDTSIVIPNTIEGIEIKYIGCNAFAHCYNLKSVTIPNGVKSIGEGVFWECTNLTNITIPSSVTNIGVCAFESCDSLTSVTIPNSITNINNGTFFKCKNLTSVVIPNSVTSIGNFAFSQCYNLKSVTIPNSVASIGEDGFKGCTNLTNINANEKNSSIVKAQMNVNIGNKNVNTNNNQIKDYNSQITKTEAIQILMKAKKYLNKPSDEDISLVRINNKEYYRILTHFTYPLSNADGTIKYRTTSDETCYIDTNTGSLYTGIGN